MNNKHPSTETWSWIPSVMLHQASQGQVPMENVWMSTQITPVQLGKARASPSERFCIWWPQNHPLFEGEKKNITSPVKQWYQNFNYKAVILDTASPEQLCWQTLQVSFKRDFSNSTLGQWAQKSTFSFPHRYRKQFKIPCITEVFQLTFNCRWRR